MIIIGCEKEISLIRAYLEGIVEAQACLLIGPPGTSKTMLSVALSKEFGIPVEVNASDSRRKDDVTQIIRSLASYSNKEKILILDEADGMKKETLTRLLSLKVKKFLLANDGSKIHWSTKKQCHTIRMPNPSEIQYKRFLELKKKSVPQEIMNKFRSWRDLNNYLEGGIPQSPINMTEHQEASAILTGEEINPHQKVHISTHDLINYYLYNGGEPEIAARAIQMLGRSSFSRKVARDLISQNLDRDIQTPWRWFSKNKRVQTKSKVEVKLLGFYKSK